MDKLLKQLYEIHSPSGNEKKMKKFICWWVRTNCPTVKIQEDPKGNLYLQKGEAATFPTIVAHLDQVQKCHPHDFTAIQANDLIFGYSPSKKQFCGLGADDKNGIWIALNCIKKYDFLKCVFFVEEEIGCRGSEEAVLDFFTDSRFIIQCDRRGGSDLITNIGGWTPLCSEAFMKAIDFEKFGYKEETGMITDVGELKERGLKVSALNMSCGYYNPHTDEEFTITSELDNCLAFVEHIIETCADVYPHEFCADDWLCSYYGYTHRDEEYDEFFDIIGNYLSYNPNVTVDEIMKEYDGCYLYLKKEDFEEILASLKNRDYYN